MAEENPTTIEEWRSSPTYPDYEVSSLGRVRSRPRPYAKLKGDRILRQKMPKRPGPQYLRVSLRGAVRKKEYVHKMVAEAFVGPCPAGHEVNHVDEVKTNNAALNLEYRTPHENKIMWRDNQRARRLSITVTVGV